MEIFQDILKFAAGGGAGAAIAIYAQLRILGARLDSLRESVEKVAVKVDKLEAMSTDHEVRVRVLEKRSAA